MLLTDGAFTRGGRFLPAPAHDPAVLQESFRRAVLAWFARQGWLEEEAAAAMLAWPHSGFGAHLGPLIAGDDRQSLTRVARYGARAPVAEDRLRYHPGRAEVELVSDATSGPYVGVHRLSALEFLARWVHHVPDHYETRVRRSSFIYSYRGWPHLLLLHEFRHALRCPSNDTARRGSWRTLAATSGLETTRRLGVVEPARR